MFILPKSNILTSILPALLLFLPCILSLCYQMLPLVYRMVLPVLVVSFLQCLAVIYAVENASDKCSISRNLYGNMEV